MNHWFHNTGYTQLPNGLVIEYKIHQPYYDNEFTLIGEVRNGIVVPTDKADEPDNWHTFKIDESMITNFKIIGIMDYLHNGVALFKMPKYTRDNSNKLWRIRSMSQWLSPNG